MAIDEAIFRQAQNSPALPTLRFYGWCRPAVSLGYFQSIVSEIDVAACRREGIDIVSRPTGGKAVYHSDDFTYAVIAGDRDALFPPDIQGTYEIIGRWLMAGLRELGIQAELAHSERDCGGAMLKTSCFSSPSRFELLAGGKKICGSAQVRSRGVFLQHGSLLVTFDPARTYAVMLPHLDPREDQERRLRESVTAVCEHVPIPGDRHMQIGAVLKNAFAEYFAATFQEEDLTPDESRLKERLLEEKYRRLCCDE